MKQNWAVLSQGRSASVLLALRIARQVKTLPLYDKDFAQPPNHADSHVIHSHRCWQKNQLSNYIKVFNLRKNPVETILSTILSNHHERYHKTHSDSFDFQAIEFTDWETVTKYCNQYQGWLQWYAEQLDADDIVIFYEDILEQLSDLNDVYLPIYLDKLRLLSNYNQVVHFINQQNLCEFQEIFFAHQNSFDLFEVINQ